MEGIVSPDSSPELSPTDFQVDLEVGRRQHQQTAQALQRQESSEMDPFLPDLDPEPEPEPTTGYDVSEGIPPKLASRGGSGSDGDEEDEEGMTTSALFPGSDIF